MEEITIGQVIVIPLIIGILEVFKRAGIDSKFIPAISLILGIISGFALNSFDMSSTEIIINSVYVGIALGLSSVGLYSGAKNTIEKKWVIGIWVKACIPFFIAKTMLI